MTESTDYLNKTKQELETLVANFHDLSQFSGETIVLAVEEELEKLGEKYAKSHLPSFIYMLYKSNSSQAAEFMKYLDEKYIPIFINNFPSELVKMDLDNIKEFYNLVTRNLTHSHSVSYNTIDEVFGFAGDFVKALDKDTRQVILETAEVMNNDIVEEIYRLHSDLKPTD